MFVAAAARLMEIGMDLAETSLKTSETAAAAGSVIAARMALMAAVVQNPLSADYVELGRMLPEKVEAFSEAGTALVNEWWELQSDAFLFVVGCAMLGQRLSLLGDVAELAERTSVQGARMAARAIGAGGIALAPIHKSATINASRLAVRHGVG